MPSVVRQIAFVTGLAAAVVLVPATVSAETVIVTGLSGERVTDDPAAAKVEILRELERRALADAWRRAGGTGPPRGGTAFVDVREERVTAQGYRLVVDVGIRLPPGMAALPQPVAAPAALPVPGATVATSVEDVGPSTGPSVFRLPLTGAPGRSVDVPQVAQAVHRAGGRLVVDAEDRANLVAVITLPTGPAEARARLRAVGLVVP